MVRTTIDTGDTPNTSNSVVVTANTANSNPEFIRLPKPGSLCPWTGLSRSKMWEEIQNSKGRIKTVCLRRKGALKGARLVHLKSLIDYLYNLMEEQSHE